MDIPPAPFWTLQLVTGFAVGGLGAYVWTRRSIPGARTLFAALVCVAYACVTSALEVRSTTIAGRLLWWSAEAPGYAAAPVCCLLMTLNYISRPLRRQWVAALFAIPAAGVLLLWTNNWHHLYWTSVWVDEAGHLPTMGRAFGVGFWICAGYSYLLMALSVFLLVHFAFQSHGHRTRTWLVTGSISLPWIANMAFIFDWTPLLYMDTTPFAFAITGFGMMQAIFRYQFQGIVPVAWTSVVGSMPDGLIALDIDERVADLNPAAEGMLGCRREKVVGHQASIALRDHPELSPYLQEGGTASGEIVFHSDKHQRICEAKAIDVRQRNRRLCRVILLHDVTAERESSVRLDLARRAAEAAASAKSRFLANMSHEIRTPMNGVLGATELLLDSGLNAEQTDLVETAQESAQCLLSILNDILDYSKIDAGKLELEEISFNVVRLANQIVRLMQPMAAKKKLDLQLEIGKQVPQILIGDPTRLRQVILNLLGNALKFTSTGWVKLALDQASAKPGQTQLTVIVSDSGIGIAPERIDSLFQEFSQADSSISRSHGGTGLGLAISRRLVEKMGGTIEVRSKPGEGSTFTAKVPFRVGIVRDAAELRPAKISRRQTFPGCRVLLAEDNLVNQKVGQRILERLGCRVDVAANGREAIARAEKAEYDLILMDLQMPEVDGLQATAQIRLRRIRTPVMALTASTMEEDRAACTAAGMDGFISKPVQIDEIISVLQRFSPHFQDLDAPANQPGRNVTVRI